MSSSSKSIVSVIKLVISRYQSSYILLYHVRVNEGQRIAYTTCVQRCTATRVQRCTVTCVQRCTATRVHCTGVYTHAFALLQFRHHHDAGAALLPDHTPEVRDRLRQRALTDKRASVWRTTGQGRTGPVCMELSQLRST